MKNAERSYYKEGFALLLIFAFAILNVGAQTSQSKEQKSFSSEGKISNAVKLPLAVSKQLALYDDGQLGECQRDKFLRRASAASHFAAAAINLNGDKRTDLIVKAETPCFMGAHNTTFWIFARASQSDYEMTFDIAADFLKILDTSTNNFRDLETASHTAVELYTIKWKFDGEKYQPSECTLSDANGKVSKVECNP